LGTETEGKLLTDLITSTEFILPKNVRILFLASSDRLHYGASRHVKVAAPHVNFASTKLSIEKLSIVPYIYLRQFDYVRRQILQAKNLKRSVGCDGKKPTSHIRGEVSSGRIGVSPALDCIKQPDLGAKGGTKDNRPQSPMRNAYPAEDY
jgi:hypothetical protein